MTKSKKIYQGIAQEQLTNEEQVSLIELLAIDLGKRNQLDRKAVLNRISKGKPLSITKEEKERKELLNLERCCKEAKYLADLVYNNTNVNEDDKCVASRCVYHIKHFIPASKSFVGMSRRKLKKICTDYNIEYDLTPFKNKNIKD